MTDNNTPSPLEVLQKGYRATLREQWAKARQKYRWSLLPRIVIGTLLFTAGYFMLYLWDGLMWWKNYFEEVLSKRGKRRA